MHPLRKRMQFSHSVDALSCPGVIPVNADEGLSKFGRGFVSIREGVLEILMKGLVPVTEDKVSRLLGGFVSVTEDKVM